MLLEGAAIRLITIWAVHFLGVKMRLIHLLFGCSVNMDVTIALCPQLASHNLIDAAFKLCFQKLVILVNYLHDSAAISSLWMVHNGVVFRPSSRQRTNHFRLKKKSFAMSIFLFWVAYSNALMTISYVLRSIYSFFVFVIIRMMLVLPIFTMKKTK